MLFHLHDLKALPDETKVKLFEQLIDVIDECPMGWTGSSLRMSRTSTQQDAIDWLTKLRDTANGAHMVKGKYLEPVIHSTRDGIYVYKTIDAYEGEFFLESTSPLNVLNIDTYEHMMFHLQNKAYVRYGKDCDLEVGANLKRQLKNHYWSKTFGDGMEILTHVDADRVIHDVKWSGPHNVLRHILHFDETGQYVKNL